MDMWASRWAVPGPTAPPRAAAIAAAAGSGGVEMAVEVMAEEVAEAAAAAEEEEEEEEVVVEEEVVAVARESAGVGWAADVSTGAPTTFASRDTAEAAASTLPRSSANPPPFTAQP